MITKVEVRTVAGALLTLTLDDVTNGFVVEDIGGLDPGKATLTSSDFAGLDGALFQAGRREPRNITMTVGLEPDYISTSVRDLRTQLYSFFQLNTDVNLRFYMVDGLTVDIVGRVESFVSTLFSQEPVVDISLICYTPDFAELDPVVMDEDTVADSSEVTIEYAGSAETGITFVLSLDRDLSEFTIYHRTPDGNISTMDFAAALLDGDALTINTNVGKKAVILLRSGTQSSVLYGRAPQSTWFALKPGTNYIRFYAVGDPIPYTLTYTTKYGGL